MVGGVKPENEQLLAEGYGSEELREAGLSLIADKIKDNGKSGVKDEGHADGGMLEITKIWRWDGAVRVKAVVPEELCEHVVGASDHDEEELQVLYFCGWEPWVDGEGFRV